MLLYNHTYLIQYPQISLPLAELGIFKFWFPNRRNATWRIWAVLAHESERDEGGGFL
jgi:hypothetical protein